MIPWGEEEDGPHPPLGDETSGGSGLVGMVTGGTFGVGVACGRSPVDTAVVRFSISGTAYVGSMVPRLTVEVEVGMAERGFVEGWARAWPSGNGDRGGRRGAAPPPPPHTAQVLSMEDPLALCAMVGGGGRGGSVAGGTAGSRGISGGACSGGGNGGPDPFSLAITAYTALCEDRVCWMARGGGEDGPPALASRSSSLASPRPLSFPPSGWSPVLLLPSSPEMEKVTRGSGTGGGGDGEEGNVMVSSSDLMGKTGGPSSPGWSPVTVTSRVVGGSPSPPPFFLLDLST